MSNDLLKEAIADAEILKDTAVESAKNILVEAISPKIKEFVDTQLGEQEAVIEMDEEEPIDMIEPEEGEKDEMEEMAGMYEADDKENDEDDLEETVEITQEDLRQAFSEVLGDVQSEAMVTKGFAEPENPNRNAPGGLKDSGAPGETGLADEKTGDNQWSEETPPDAEDWTVKEAYYKKQLNALVKQNKGLQREASMYKNGVVELKRKLQEVAVFNSKLIHTNKILQSHGNLSSKQRVAIIEALDKAETMREVKLVYRSLSESLKIAGVMNESRQSLKSANARRSAGQGGASKVLNENKDNEPSDWAERQQFLSGLLD